MYTYTYICIYKGCIRRRVLDEYRRVQRFVLGTFHVCCKFRLFITFIIDCDLAVSREAHGRHPGGVRVEHPVTGHVLKVILFVLGTSFMDCQLRLRSGDSRGYLRQPRQNRGVDRKFLPRGRELSRDYMCVPGRECTSPKLTCLYHGSRSVNLRIV